MFKKECPADSVEWMKCSRTWRDVERSYWRSADRMKTANNVSDSEEIRVIELAPAAQHTHTHLRLETYMARLFRTFVGAQLPLIPLPSFVPIPRPWLESLGERLSSSAVPGSQTTYIWCMLGWKVLLIVCDESNLSARWRYNYHKISTQSKVHTSIQQTWYCNSVSICISSQNPSVSMQKLQSGGRFAWTLSTHIIVSVGARTLMHPRSRRLSDRLARTIRKERNQNCK